MGGKGKSRREGEGKVKSGDEWKEEGRNGEGSRFMKGREIKVRKRKEKERKGRYRETERGKGGKGEGEIKRDEIN